MLNQHFALVHPTLQPQDPPALAAERILSNINAESLFFIGRNATTLSTGQSKHSLVHKFIVTGHQSSIPMEYQALECSVVDPTAAPAPRQSSQDALCSAVPGWDGNTTPIIRWPSLTNEFKALLRHTCPKIAELIDRNPSTTATFDTNLSSPVDTDAYTTPPPSHSPLPPAPPLPPATTPDPPPPSALLLALEDTPSIRRIATIKSAEALHGS